MYLLSDILNTFETLSSNPIAVNTYDGSPALQAEPVDKASLSLIHCVFNVKIPELYEMGYSRNGCMYCGFGVHLEPRGDNRYQKLRKTHPVQYSYFIYNFGDLIIQCDVNAA